MADGLNSLLQAYLDKIEDENDSGDDLYFIKSWFALRNPAQLPDLFQTKFPLVLVYPVAPIPVASRCIPRSEDEKLYRIRVSLFEQIVSRDNQAFYWVNGTNYLNDFATHIQTLETMFQCETFNISAQCTTTELSCEDMTLPGYDGIKLDQGHITFEHIYFDTFGGCL